MLALTCLDQVIRGTLSRWVPTGVPKQDIHKWLPRVCKPILQGVRKAYFQFPEQQVRVRSPPPSRGQMENFFLFATGAFPESLPREPLWLERLGCETDTCYVLPPPPGKGGGKKPRPYPMGCKGLSPMGWVGPNGLLENGP